MPRFRIQAPLIFLTIFTSGCGGKMQPSPVPVQGRVLGRDGKSIGPVIVIFWPEDSKNNRMATGTCEPDGSFRLKCVPGKYKVTISPIRQKGATSPPSPNDYDSGIPARIQSELTTTLNVTVRETGNDPIILNLK
jgi:hypothetical protein